MKINMFDVLAAKAAREIFLKGLKVGLVLGVTISVTLFVIAHHYRVGNYKSVGGALTAVTPTEKPLEAVAVERLQDVKFHLDKIRLEGADFIKRWNFQESLKKAKALEGLLKEKNPAMWQNYMAWVNYYENEARKVW